MKAVADFLILLLTIVKGCHQMYWLGLKDRDHWKLTRPTPIYPGAWRLMSGSVITVLTT